MMYSRNLFGDYYPVVSKVHEVNVLIKLINFLLFVLVMIGSKSITLHLFISAIIVLQMIESKVPMRFYFNMFYGMRYVYIILIVLFASLGFSLEVSLVYLLKVILIIMNLALMIFTTSMSEFDYGVYKVLNSINFLNLNVSYVTYVFGSIFRFIPMFIVSEHNVLKSQASRGIDYYHSGIIGRVYATIYSFINTPRLTIKKMKVMRSMCKELRFDIRVRRTNLRSGKFNFYAFMLLMFHVLFLFGYIMEVGIL